MSLNERVYPYLLDLSESKVRYKPCPIQGAGSLYKKGRKAERCIGGPVRRQRLLGRGKKGVNNAGLERGGGCNRPLMNFVY